MTLDDIINEINGELDQVLTQSIVGDEQIYSDSGTTTEITSTTTWNSIYDSTGAQLNFSDGDSISFSGTTRNGSAVSGNHQISDVTRDTVQGLLSAIENAFSGNVIASIDTSGRIVVTDEFEGTSQLSLDSISHASEGEFFGSVDVTGGAGDGSQQGRYAMDITAMDNGSNHLMLRNDKYGSTAFTISQDVSDDQYHYMIYSDTSNTTQASDGAVQVTGDTTWADVYGANVTAGETIQITGTARSGAAISGTHTIDTGSTIDTLLQDIETAYAAQGTTVDAFIRDGRIYVEDTTAPSAGANPITLSLHYTGSGTLDLGLMDQSTERDLDLGLINGEVSGKDVAGTLDGESATGSGQLLRGDDGNTNTDGLAISYTGSSNDTNVGSVKVTLGIAELLDRALFSITDAFEGYVAFKQDSLQNSIGRFEDQIQEMEERLDRRMEVMITRFVTMELTLSQLQNQSNWLAGQISSMFKS
jgi:flagellar hook-associated protein 2